LLPPRRFSISAGCINRGLIVMRLSPAGPAAPAGLMIGDILIEL
jgi:S1-C subfamily serine protease